MRYQDLAIQTQREAPNNARTQGFAFLVRAGYLTRENEILPLGQRALQHLQRLARENDAFFSHLSLPVISGQEATFFPLPTGSTDMLHCPACGYAQRGEMASFVKPAPEAEGPLPLEKVATPGCNTIEDLAQYLGIPKAKTAKALLFTRPADGKFIFAMVRGDMQLSETKMKAHVGEVRAATAEEIAAAGAAAGYASPIGLRDALITVDDLIPNAPNLVAGANETGYHLKHVNYGRDYSASLVADLAQAQAGDGCPNCGEPLAALRTDLLASVGTLHFERILHALAETHHDQRGLTLPHPAAPFDVYLMHIPGRETDTLAAAEQVYARLTGAGISVLFDAREERAGVKFNDADLIGCPLRVTVGEKHLVNGMVELKPRTATENRLISLDNVIEATAVLVK